MEKVIYALWKDADTSVEDFNTALLQETGAKLKPLARAVRINIQDAIVANGSSPRAVSTKPQMHAMVQLWIDSANDALRAPIDRVIAQACSRFEAWLVSESTPLPNTLHPPREGQRTEGFSQMVFLKRPDDLAWEDWRAHWHDVHTQVAVETQSNFEYHQNLVTRRLTDDSGDYAAIVEECFPLEALKDALVYFDAPGDAPKMQTNLAAMMESVAKFIDHSKMDCIPTSQYDLKR